MIFLNNVLLRGHFWEGIFFFNEWKKNIFCTIKLKFFFLRFNIWKIRKKRDNIPNFVQFDMTVETVSLKGFFFLDAHLLQMSWRDGKNFKVEFGEKSKNFENTFWQPLLFTFLNLINHQFIISLYGTTVKISIAQASCSILIPFNTYIEDQFI